MAKRIIRLTENELTDLIQRIVVETKMSEVEAPEMEERELEEGMFGPSAEELESRKMDLIRKMDDTLEEFGVTEEELQNSIDSVLEKASENGYDGEVSIQIGRRSGRPLLSYKANPSRFHRSKFYQNVVQPMVGGMKRGHKFGSGE